MLLLKALVGLLAFLLLLALALGGLAAAIFSIAGDGATLSLGQLAEWLHLPGLRDEVGDLLVRLEDDDVPDGWSLLGGALSVLVGILLLFGLFGRRRARAVPLEPTGHLRARRRALADVVSDLAGRAPGVSAVRTRVRGRRQAVVAVDAAHTPRVSSEEAQRSVGLLMTELTATGSVRPKVRARPGDGGERVR